MTMGELRELITEEIFKDSGANFVSTSKDGVELMRSWARLFADDGYRFSPHYYDSLDGATWPVVRHGNDKHVFECQGTMFVRDDSFGWLLVDHRDMALVLERFATEVLTDGIERVLALRRFRDGIRLAAAPFSVD